MLPPVTRDLASGEPEALSIESPLLARQSVATPPLVNPPPRAPRIRLVEEPFDPAWTNEGHSLSTAHTQAFLHPSETPKTQENRSLLHLLDSKVTWLECSDAITVPYQEIEPEHPQTPPGVAWFRTLGRWFGHSKQTAGVIPEVKFELDDMPVDEFPIIPHTSGEYKPPWLSLAPLHPPGQSIIATLDFSAFDRIVDVDEPFATTLYKEGEGDGSD